MKKILLLISTIILFASCDIKMDKAELLPETSFDGPTLMQQADVIVNKDNVKKESVTFKWSSANFGQDVQIEYVVYAKYGENTARVGSSFSNSLIISKLDFNGLVCNELKVAKNITAAIESYVVATILDTEVKEMTSPAISYNVTTFEAPRRWIFMPGAYQGWAIEQAPLIWETEGGTNVYETLVNLDLGDGNTVAPFKFTNAQNWSSGNWGCNNFTTLNWTMPAADGDNITLDITNGGIFSFSINTTKWSVTKTDIKSVNILGSFGGWDAGEQDLTYDPVENVWTSQALTFGADGTNFLIRFNKSWDRKFGVNGKNSDDIEGGIQLVSGGGDINVPETGTYIMKLYANRTPYVLVMEKQ